MQDDGHDVAITCRAADGIGDLSIVGHEGDAMPATSVFRSVASASAFFERGSDGYSGPAFGISSTGCGWKPKVVRAPIRAHSVSSAFFDDRGRFPSGSVAFDNALVMRDVAHAWRALPSLERRRGLIHGDSPMVGISGSR